MPHDQTAEEPDLSPLTRAPATGTVPRGFWGASKYQDSHCWLSTVGTAKQSAQDRPPFHCFPPVPPLSLYLRMPGHGKEPLASESSGTPRQRYLPGRTTALGCTAPGFSTVPTSSLVPGRSQERPQALPGPHHPEPSPSLQPGPSARGPQDWGPEVCKSGCGQSPFTSSPFQEELILGLPPTPGLIRSRRARMSAKGAAPTLPPPPRTEGGPL